MQGISGEDLKLMTMRDWKERTVGRANCGQDLFDGISGCGIQLCQDYTVPSHDPCFFKEQRDLVKKGSPVQWPVSQSLVDTGS